MGSKYSVSRKEAQESKPELVHQFLIVLSNTDPVVWRRIQVPEDSSFWDLHVAIQDAMGWQDYHLHEFTIVHPTRGRVERLGIPDEDFPDERPCRPDWKVKLSNYVTYGGPPFLYAYDFGDNWHHLVMYEGHSPREASASYPRCLSGARKCPPEDCGGVHGYVRFLEAIKDPDHPEHEELLQWAGGSFDPDAFDPARVVFDDPKKRWKIAFEGDSYDDRKEDNKVVPLQPAGPFTGGAKKRWDKIPKWAQAKILDNVFCRKCLDSVPMILETAKMEGVNLILRGKCKVCGQEVCRLVEPEGDN